MTDLAIMSSSSARMTRTAARLASVEMVGKYQLLRNLLVKFLHFAIFPLRKMKKNEQTSETAMLSRFQVGAVLLPPLIVKSCTVLGGPKEKADARVELALPRESEGFCFAVEVKARATP